MVNKRIKNATPTEYNGISFKSKLEVSLYKVLEEESFKPMYEPYKFVIWEGYIPKIPFYIQDKATKCITEDKRKIRDIHYTPDIVFLYKDYIIFLEVKGIENDIFPYKRKLFRKYLEDKTFNNKKPIYCEVKTKRSLIEFLKILKTNY